MLNKYVFRISVLSTILSTIGIVGPPLCVFYAANNQAKRIIPLIIIMVIFIAIACFLHAYTTSFPIEKVIYGYNPDKSSWGKSCYNISYITTTFKNWKDIYTINPSIWNLTYNFPWETTALPNNNKGATAGEGIGVQFKLFDFYRYRHFAKYINTYNEMIKQQKENNKLMTTLLAKAQDDINKDRRQHNKEMKHAVNNILEIHNRAQEEV